MIPNPLFLRGVAGGMSFCKICHCWVRRDGEKRHTKTKKHQQVKDAREFAFFSTPRSRPRRIAAKRRRK